MSLQEMTFQRSKTGNGETEIERIQQQRQMIRGQQQQSFTCPSVNMDTEKCLNVPFPPVLTHHVDQTALVKACLTSH